MRALNSDSDVSVGEIVDMSAPASSTSSAFTMIASLSSGALEGPENSISTIIGFAHGHCCADGAAQTQGMKGRQSIQCNIKGMGD